MAGIGRRRLPAGLGGVAAVRQLMAQGLVQEPAQIVTEVIQ